MSLQLQVVWIELAIIIWYGILYQPLHPQRFAYFMRINLQIANEVFILSCINLFMLAVLMAWLFRW